jgi:hypothetical protein
VKSIGKFSGIMAVAFLTALTLTLALSGVAGAKTWPKKMEGPKGTVIMYQPQLETFQGDKLTARAAVSVQTKEMKNPVFGVVWINARVSTDRDTRMVTVEEAKITDAKFTGATPEQLAKLKSFLDKEMESWNHEISLDRLLAMLDVIEKEKAGDRGLNNNPPRIIFVNHPAVLVLLDGEPRLQPLEKTPLMRVVNTPFLMLYDPAGKIYYLKGDGWLTATDLKGPWKEAAELPQAIKDLEAKAEKGKEAQPAKKVEASTGKKPEVVVSTVPAELITTDGEPNYTPISGGSLLYLSNTESNVFLDTASQQFYVLLAGRWFTSKSLTEGPWSYVAPDKLPGDFAKIPPASPKGYVRVSVAGTEEAQDAVHETYIPQTAAIDRKKATTTVKYDGEPKFAKIANSDLEYAQNTGTAVFKEGTKYYACDQGIWYEAASPNGPWQVSVSAPQQIDRVPPSNPHYNTRYVQVYDSTPDVAYVGYTPGYTESYVDNGAVVYGTGYDYPAYSSNTAYIPYPATYGYAPCYDPYAGSWGYQPSYDPTAWLVSGMVGMAAGVAIGAAIWNRPGPYWGGGYWGGGGFWGPGGYNNININNIHNNVINYHPNRRGPDHRPNGRPIHHPVYKPGERPGGGHAGNRPNLYNRPGNQDKLAQRQQKPATRPGTAGKPGQPAAKRPGARPEQRPGTVAQAKPGQQRPGQGKPGQVRPGQTKPGQTRPAQARPGQNNVYAGKNGNVYRKTDAGWQQRQGNQWSKPASAAQRPSQASRPAASTRPSTTAPRRSFDPAPLNRDYQARQHGAARTQNYQRAQSAPASRPSYSRPSGGGGGGGRSYGGGGRPSGGGGRGGGGRGGRR